MAECILLLFAFLVGYNVDNHERFLAQFGTSGRYVGQTDAKAFIALFNVVTWKNVDWDDLFIDVVRKD